MSEKISDFTSPSLRQYKKHGPNDNSQTIATQFGDVLNQSIHDDDRKRRKIVPPDELEKDHLLADKDLIEDGKHLRPEEEEDSEHVVAQKLKKKIKALIQLERNMLGL